MKNQTNAAQAENPLGTAPVGSLITKFAIPAIISMLVSALYNIVDQIFIGQGVGMLGNAATNIAFPVTIISTAAALLLGIGSASNYNLEMGAGNEKKPAPLQEPDSPRSIISGTILSVIVLLFLKPLLHFFGGTPDVMPYAIDYIGDHRHWASLLCFKHRRQPPDPSRQESYLFHGLHPGRCRHQHHPGPAFHLWIRLGHQRCSLGNRDRPDRIRTSDHLLFFQTPENVPGPLHADS